MAEFTAGTPETAWVEIHSENYFVPGGLRIAQLNAVRALYPISCHGVGLSLGTVSGINQVHLDSLKTLVDTVEPGLVSEHLSFSVVDGLYVNDLLPLPYTEEALAVMVRNIDHVQSALGRHILIENPSTYFTFAETVMTEWEFLSELVTQTECGLLLDINNVYVSAHNNGLDRQQYLQNIPEEAVEEIHLAGHLIDGEGEERLLIDTHGDSVTDAVWTLYEQTIQRIGPRPTLIEWDADIPPLDILLAEADKAQTILNTATSYTGKSHVA